MRGRGDQLLRPDELAFYQYAMGYTNHIEGKVGRMLQKAREECDNWKPPRRRSDDENETREGEPCKKP